MNTQSISKTSDASSDTYGLTLVESRRARRVRKKRSFQSSTPLIKRSYEPIFTVVFLYTISTDFTSRMSRYKVSKIPDINAPGNI